MSKSKTPRTDAAERKGNKAITLPGNLRIVLEHARTLELELTAATERVRDLSMELHNIVVAERFNREPRT